VKTPFGKRILTSLAYSGMVVPLLSTMGAGIAPAIGADPTTLAVSFGISSFAGCIGIGLAQDMHADEAEENSEE